MRQKTCVLRHRFLGRTTLQLIIERTSCRQGVILVAAPKEYRFLEGLAIRTLSGWYKARQADAHGSTWLNPWHLIVQIPRGGDALLISVVTGYAG